MMIRRCYRDHWWFWLVREPLAAAMRLLAVVNGIRPKDYAARNPECRGCIRFIKAELEIRSAVFRFLNGFIGPRFRKLRDSMLEEKDFAEAKKHAAEMMALLAETEAHPPDLIRPDYMDEEFEPSPELDIPIEGSRNNLSIPPDLLRDEEDDGEDFFPPAPKSGARLMLPALLPVSAGLHVAVFLFFVFFVTLPEIPLSGDPGDPDLEISWATLLGGGAEPETPEETLLEPETPPEPEPEPEPLPEPEPDDAPEALKAPEEKPPPPEKKKPPKKQLARKNQTPEPGAAKAPPGPGSPDGHSLKGGGGSGVKGEGSAVWKAVSVPKPAYADTSAAAGEQGQCVVRVTVLPSGQIGGVDLVKSSGFGRLDQAALAAARRIQFKLNGPRPAHSVTVKVPYRFSLKNR